MKKYTSVYKGWKKSWSMVLDQLYPSRCAICDKILRYSEQYCCDSCRSKLPWTGSTVCLKCGKPIAHAEREFCPDCTKFSHHFDQGAAPFVYSGELRHSVYRMKHENRRDYLDFYAAVMAEYGRRYLEVWKPDLIIPVPMHWKRKRMRGYNQSEILAEKISSCLEIPCDKNRIRCTRITGQQKLLGRRERMQNLEGCFQVIGEFQTVKKVLIIDDIYTTGSTMDEIASALKKAGVTHVFFLVLCTGKGKIQYA